jgi:hypothetical protein
VKFGRVPRLLLLALNASPPEHSTPRARIVIFKSHTALVCAVVL